MTPALLEVQNLSRQFRSGRQTVTVLDNLSFQLAPTELRVIAGRSGSGKTTLLHLLAGLDTPSSGTLKLEELHLSRRAARSQVLEWRRRVSFLHQTPALIPTLSAWENALLPFRYAGKPDLEWVSYLFSRLGLAGLQGRRPRQLSGGQAMRVSLVRALARQGSLLLADEPTGRLDATSALEVWTLLEELCSEGGLSAVVVTHDPIVLERALRVFQLEAGALALERVPVPLERSNTPIVRSKSDKKPPFN